MRHMSCPNDLLVEAITTNRAVSYGSERGEHDPITLSPAQARTEAKARLANPKLRTVTRAKLSLALADQPTKVKATKAKAPAKPRRKADPAKAAANLAFRRCAAIAEDGERMKAGRRGTRFAYDLNLTVAEVEALSDEDLQAVIAGA